VKRLEVMGINVVLQGFGGFLQISFVVFNFRLMITLRRPGARSNSYLDIEPEPNRTNSGVEEGPLPLTNSALIDHAPRPARTSLSASFRPASRRPSGDAS